VLSVELIIDEMMTVNKRGYGLRVHQKIG